jgi:hypothetical protein
VSDSERDLAIIAERRRERDRTDERVRAIRRRLSSVSAELDASRRLGARGTDRARVLEEELKRLTVELEAETRRLGDRVRDLAASLDRFLTADDPTTLIERLEDRTPILLLPVRVETRFMPVTAPRELWVRIFPDDIAVHTHERELTAGEIAAGRRYWEDVAAAAGLPDDERRARERAAWQALAGTTEAPRAAWIIRQTNPNAPPADDADQPTNASEGDAAPATWGRAPRSNVMPDRFAVILQSAGRADRTVFGNQVPDPLILGPDPSAGDLDIDRVDGNIQLSDDLRWMHDFEEAVRIGMAIKVPLSAPEVASGFDRLFVLGMRLSSDPQHIRTLVEDLIDNHHYSPDGAAFIPQGTATNNTSDTASGFRSVTLDSSESEAVEVGDPLFAPVDDVTKRRDAQWLAESLGIDYVPLTHLQHADRADVSEARLMNQALWPATLGYYLEQMLGVDAARMRELERYFVEHVSARGPLPALRIGTQPYGVLVTSDAHHWRDARVEGATARVPQQVRETIARLEPIWERAFQAVSFAGKPGDSHAQLLDILGLHATSVDYFRRYAVGSGYLWNYAQFSGWGSAAGDMRRIQAGAAQQVLEEVAWPLPTPPPIADLTFFSRHTHITDPFVADVPVGEDERWSEDEGLRRLYTLADSDALHNYIEWLLGTAIAEIKAQTFHGADGGDLPVPRPLLYRLLRHALLLANVDAALQLYEAHGVVTAGARQEIELPNVRADRTVTRWEFLEARADRVLPQLTDRPIEVAEYLGTDEGQAQPAASDLAQVRAALQELVDLPTARLERLFAEHIDLCTYRIDAWQTALFTERLRMLRDPKGTGLIADRALGVHLGAFGWLEEVRPGTIATPVAQADVPESLRSGDDPIVEQPDSGGAIHVPSTTHAVAAAVLRNAYLTHAAPGSAELMSVNLSSERVRLATYYLEAISNGQSLGALLGYQFQRGLKERHGDPSLAQFIPNFRDAYPMRADKITADASGNETSLKEANNVFDGYALLERTLLAAPPLGYPYAVEGLPSSGSAQAAAIQQEVDRMAQTLDAIGDLALAEGVYQVAHGNYDRSGAMLQAISRGTQPPQPEVVRTPRSGAAVNHRVAVHLDPASPDHVWTGESTPRSRAEPALNAWLGEHLGDPATIRYLVLRGPDRIEDGANSITDLGLEPIDLIHIVGDELTDGESELVRRMRHAYRVNHGGTDAPAVQTLALEFPPRHPDWGDSDRSLFEMMPLIAALKRVATGARPLGAGDYMLPSEDVTDPATDPNPQRFDEGEIVARLDIVLGDFSLARGRLTNAVADATALDPFTATESERIAALTTLMEATRAMASFGLADAFVDSSAVPPHAGDPPTPFERALAHHLDLASSVLLQSQARLTEAQRLRNFTDLDAAAIAQLTVAQKVDRYRDAARQVLGTDYNLLPRFVFKNAAELTAAAAFRDLPIDTGLLRHSADPLIVDEWFQGVACVRDRLRTLETIAAMDDAFGTPAAPLRPLQLPFRNTDFWVAMPYPDASVSDDGEQETAPFQPVGDFLSVVQELRASGFNPAGAQTGLLVDAWSEVIPGRVETTGIAVHYNQPNAQPPQALLLAVAPQLTGTWKWDALVGILSDTLRRAKLRAVEPDQIEVTSLGHLLPAILTPAASRPDATVTEDLVHVTGTVVDGG